MTRIPAIALIFAASITAPCCAADWPQFRGPNRDGKSVETGLLDEWPKNGPAHKWTIAGIHEGYSSPSIAKGRIYVTGLNRRNGTGILTAVNLEGRILWQRSYGPEWTRSMPGVRCTPTFHRDRLYLISGTGNVLCFDAATGRLIWKVDTADRFGRRPGPWGIAESPLVYGNNVICTPGGSDATIAALDRKTGETVWAAQIHDQKSACCSPILITRSGRTIVVTMLEDYLVGVDASTGNPLWTDRFADYQEDPTAINPVSPVYHKGSLYATSGYNDGGAMYSLSPDAAAIHRIWTDTVLDCHHGGVVLVDGLIYGSDYASVFHGDWACIEWETGAEKYVNRWQTKGSVIYADGMLYCYDEKDGTVALVKPNPERFRVVSTFQSSHGKGRHWAHPAISEATLYIRHGDTLSAYDIKK